MGDEESKPSGEMELQRYAAIVARLIDPFAHRASVLAARGLDETTWATLDTSWRAEMTRRSAAGDDSLARAFRHAFEQERAKIEDERRPAAPMHATSPQATDVDTTLPANVVLEPALPFGGSREAPALAEVTMHDDDLDGTAVMEEGAGLDLTLPFDES